MRRLRARGFTLIEMMAVVAIVGILSSISVVQIQRVSAVGRVNGGATSMARLMSSARIKALTMHCPVLVQINGPTYVNAAPPIGFPTRTNTAMMVIKGDCNSTNAFFEEGDRLTSEFAFEGQLKLQFPAAVIAGGLLTNQSIVFSFPADTTSLKTVTVDSAGSGVFATAAIGLVDIQYTANVPDVIRHSYIPDQAIPYCD